MNEINIEIEEFENKLKEKLKPEIDKLVEKSIENYAEKVQDFIEDHIYNNSAWNFKSLVEQRAEQIIGYILAGKKQYVKQIGINVDYDLYGVCKYLAENYKDIITNNQLKELQEENQRLRIQLENRY